MSGQNTPARVLKSSPNSAKQGPLKATIPMSSLLKNSSTLKVVQSPTSSPTCWRTRTSPDHSLGQRSPGSVVHKAKSKTLGSVSNPGGNVIRRTASLDTIYLKGQWPRDSYYWQTGNLQIDKSTQTDDRDWSDSRKIHCIVENEDKLEKMIIQKKLQRSNNQHSPNGRPPISPGNLPDHTLTASSQTNTSCLISPLAKALPLNIPIKPLPKPTMRSSVEGLNQEIEGLVLKSASSGSNNSDRHEEYDKFCQVTPEGHRAPFPEMFRHTRSVNTQTPSTRDLAGSCHSSSPPSRDSISPMIAGHMESSASDTDGSQGSSPDQDDPAHNHIKLVGSSPQLFLARGPPDGCEKVHLKSLEERQQCDEQPVAARQKLERPLAAVDSHQHQQPFQLKQSLGSAFQLLQRPSVASSSSTTMEDN